MDDFTFESGGFSDSYDGYTPPFLNDVLTPANSGDVVADALSDIGIPDIIADNWMYIGAAAAIAGVLYATK